MEAIARAAAWVVPFALLVMSIISVPLLILGDEGLPRYRQLKDELQETRSRNDQLRREIQDLQHEVRAVRRSPQAVERIARNELGMIRDGEIVFQFPD